MAKQQPGRRGPKTPRKPQGLACRSEPTPAETITVADAARRLGISKSLACRGTRPRRRIPLRAAYRRALGGAEVAARASLLTGEEPSHRLKLTGRPATGAISAAPEVMNFYCREGCASAPTLQKQGARVTAMKETAPSTTGGPSWTRSPQIPARPARLQAHELDRGLRLLRQGLESLAPEEVAPATREDHCPIGPAKRPGL